MLLVIVETFQLLHYSVHESYSGLWNSQLQTALALLFGYSDLSRLWVVFGEYAIMVFVSVCNI